MTTSKAFYIVTVAGGKCLENTQSAHGVLDCIPRETESQKWFIETDENDENVVAFKSCVDGQYLHNNEPAKITWGKIGMGEKQWWILEKGKNPGSCLIRSKACTTGNSYLNDFNGRYQDRNYVHMWQLETARQFWLDWFIMPTDVTFHPEGTSAASGSNQLDGSDLAQKSEDLAAKETALKKREKELAEQEAAMKKGSVNNAASGGGDVGAKEAALKKREEELAKKEAELRERLKYNNAAAQDREEDNDSGTKSTLGDESQSAGQLELLKAENENLKLKLRIQELEGQLKDSRKPSSKEDTCKPARPKAPSSVNPGSLGKKDPVVYECGHIAYPPPRKLRRHVVGMLYEGLDHPFELSPRQKTTLAKHQHH